MQKRFDTIIFLSVMALLSIGVVMVYSSSSIVALKRYDDGYYFLKRQLLFASIGVFLMLAVSKIDYRVYQRFAYPLLGITLLSLVLVLIPHVGADIAGTRRWFRIGGFTFQPSEFMKLVMVIYMAHSLSKKGDRVKAFSVGIVPHMMVLGFTLLLMLMQPDFGTSMAIAAVVFIMLFTAGARLTHLISLILLSLPAIYLLVFRVAYRRRRMMAFLNPWDDPQNVGFQIIQSFLAFGSGGSFGVGLGDGRQKMFYLPESFTDFIFSTIAEEIGLVGVLIIIALFVTFIIRGLKMSLRMSDPFGRYLALGLTSVVGLQAFINMAVVMGLLPTKGLPLPFISYGGSSIVTTLIGVGILLNISSHEKEGR
ncbi:MAG TPA: putative lipid II flippase FtsW [Thermodesulfobacteriota bacterium]|nr:putative lipid II flippase FtsW [Thermodesulfobacteriota bacterium]